MSAVKIDRLLKIHQYFGTKLGINDWQCLLNLCN